MAGGSLLQGLIGGGMAADAMQACCSHDVRKLLRLAGKFGKDIVYGHVLGNHLCLRCLSLFHGCCPRCLYFALLLIFYRDVALLEDALAGQALITGRAEEIVLLIVFWREVLPALYHGDQAGAAQPILAAERYACIFARLLDPGAVRKLLPDSRLKKGDGRHCSEDVFKYIRVSEWGG